MSQYVTKYKPLVTDVVNISVWKTTVSWIFNNQVLYFCSRQFVGKS